VPILSQIPIIGNLFKSKAERKERTELLVLVTPRLVRPLNPDEVPPLPTLPGQFLPEDEIGAQLQGGGGVVDAPAISTRRRESHDTHSQRLASEKGAVFIHVPSRFAPMGILVHVLDPASSGQPGPGAERRRRRRASGAGRAFDDPAAAPVRAASPT
jgi:hypothetical protein